jgi:hypothetical protein
MQSKNIGIYDRSFEERDPEGLKVYSSKRNLKQIWRNEHDIFGPLNTLVIDFDTIKMRDYIGNTFIIEPYTKEMVADECSEL